MDKLRQIMTESKFLKREFGEPLPTFKDVMEKHQVNKLKEDWWDDLGPEGQKRYLKNNPGSKKAQDAKKDKDSDDAQKKGMDRARDLAKKGMEKGEAAAQIKKLDQQIKDLDDAKWKAVDSGDHAAVANWGEKLQKAKKEKEDLSNRMADDEADDMKSQDAQDEKDAEDKRDAGITPIKADADTKRMGDSIQRKIGGSKDPDRLELQGTQEASNGETIIQFKDKDDGMMVGVDAQGNIYEDGEKQAYGVDVSTQSDVFGDDQNAQLLYKQKKARETGGTDPFTGEEYPKPEEDEKEQEWEDPRANPDNYDRRGHFRPRRTGKELNREDFLKENPIVAATVNHMTQMHLQNPQTGRRIKATTPLRNKEHPLHKKSVSIFKKIKDKLTPKKKEEPKKQSQSDVDFYRKQYAARTGKELRRTEMKITEDAIRKVIREEIKNIMMEEDDAFNQPIPAQIDRFMKKFIGAMEGKNLNRKRKLAILGRVIVALRLDPSEVSKYARLVKKEL